MPYLFICSDASGIYWHIVEHCKKFQKMLPSVGFVAAVAVWLMLCMQTVANTLVF